MIPRFPVADFYRPTVLSIGLATVALFGLGAVSAYLEGELLRATVATVGTGFSANMIRHGVRSL